MTDLPLREVAAALRTVPLDELPEFRALLEAATRDLSRPLGRKAFAVMVLAAVDAMAGGADPLDVMRVYDDALKLAGTPAASRVSIEQRIAALPRTELAERGEP